jgi:ABC-2 type transport system ATP-binding protein
MRYLVIRTENLSKSYGRHSALRNLTLEVEPGEIYGVLGPQGSGKTTLIHLLLNIVHPSNGNARIMGFDCHRQGEKVRSSVGFASEKISTRLKGEGEKCLIHFANLRGRADLGIALDIAEKFKLDLQKPVAAYNPGELRQLELVQAFMFQPELVILDEPSRDLDSNGQAVLYQLINAVRAEGRTVLISSESLVEMERICDRVAVLYRGGLVAVERGVQLRARALRHIEMRFAGPVSREDFSGIANLNNLVLEDNKLRCTLQGDPDVLIKAASRHRIMDFISQQPSLEEVYQTYYGLPTYAA